MKKEFSHCMYDDLTETLFLYFKNATIQNLGSGDLKETQLEEFCIHVNADQTHKLVRMISHEEQLYENRNHG